VQTGERDIMRQTGHKSSMMLDKCIRIGQCSPTMQRPVSAFSRRSKVREFHVLRGWKVG
jgi:hypothetical protein